MTAQVPTHSLLRIVSLGLIFITHALLSAQVWLSVMMAIGLGHYALSYIYSVKQQKAAFSSAPLALRMVFLIATGLALYAINFPLVLFFLPHHIFNEVYSLKRVIGGKDLRGSAFWRGSALVFHSLLYCALLLPHDPRLMKIYQMVPSWALPSGTLIAFGVFLLALRKMKAPWNREQWIDACSQELIGLGLLGAVIFMNLQITFMDIVAYHFMFWVFYPLKGLSRAGRKPVLRYLMLSVLITAPLICLSPVGFAPYPMIPSVFYSQFFLWSYLHITTAAALSDAHPAWVVAIFRPRRLLGAKA